MSNPPLSGPIGDDSWRPTCSLQTLRARAAMLHATRDFFRNRGYLEVETPCLSRDIVIDAWLEPMALRIGSDAWYLQTSPEAFMKRLLASEAGSVFQICRVFRKGEQGDRHNSEFTMLEWYGVDTTWRDQVDLTEQLVRAVAAAATTELTTGFQFPLWSTDAFRCTTYAEAFARHFDIDVHSATRDQLITCARTYDVALPPDIEPLDRDDILNVMLGLVIEPHLGKTRAGQSSPEFLCDYPPTQAALAVTSDDEPVVARRFELYIDGIELCNGYQELIDPEELARREHSQNDVRTRNGFEPLPGARHLLAAMRHGLPACSGVALGFDRLVMIATGARKIGDVIPFPSTIS